MLEKVKKALLRLVNNERAVSTGEMVGLAVSFFLVAILGPIAIGTIANATTTNWTATTILVFQTLCPVLWSLGVAIRYLPKRG